VVVVLALVVVVVLVVVLVAVVLGHALLVGLVVGLHVFHSDQTVDDGRTTSIVTLYGVFSLVDVSLQSFLEVAQRRGFGLARTGFQHKQLDGGTLGFFTCGAG
jgi:hypothetical protein